MRTITGIIAAAALAVATQAFAADMPRKAPPVSPFVNLAKNGFYVGVGTSAALANSNVSGNVISIPGITGGNVNAAGGTIDADVGYIWGSCFLNSWCQVEADFKYQNIGGATPLGSVSSRWAMTQEADIGIDLLQLVLSYVPSLGSSASIFPTIDPTSLLPANVKVANTPRGYVGFKQEEILVNGQVGQVGGQTWEYAPGVTTGWRWQTLGATGLPNGASIKVFGDILFADKGVTISDLFGVGGAPVVTQAKAGMNTLYVAGVHVDFGL